MRTRLRHGTGVDVDYNPSERRTRGEGADSVFARDVLIAEDGSGCDLPTPSVTP